MAYQGQVSQAASLLHFTQHLHENQGVLEKPHHQMDGVGGGGGEGSSWLSTALLRQQTPSCLHLQAPSGSTSSGERWSTAGDAAIAAAMSRSRADGAPALRRNDSGINYNNNNDNNCCRTSNSTGNHYSNAEGEHGSLEASQNARYKAEILAHPLYEQLISAHVACLRIATPVDHLLKIDAQLGESRQAVARYSLLGGLGNQILLGQDKELDQFMTHYFLWLCSFKEQLQQHVRVHAMEAVMACWELEQSLQSLTGVSPGEGIGATMSDDDEQADRDASLYDGSLEGHDSMSIGPLVPTENERSLMERVRQELKHELKQGYKEKIVGIREEILRKRRAGKLPGDTTSLLKAWWQSHSKWPYPTEDDKARLVQETGLQMKQINNWFINQRKRNWNSNPSSAMSKCRRKSNAGDDDNA